MTWSNAVDTISRLRDYSFDIFRARFISQEKKKENQSKNKTPTTTDVEWNQMSSGSVYRRRVMSNISTRCVSLDSRQAECHEFLFWVSTYGSLRASFAVNSLVNEFICASNCVSFSIPHPLSESFFFSPSLAAPGGCNLICFFLSFAFLSYISHAAHVQIQIKATSIWILRTKWNS